MMRRKQMFSVFALIAPFAIAAVTASPISVSSNASAAGMLPNLCESTHGACEYTSINAAPVLRSNVCWDGRTTELMGTAGCKSGSRGYHLTFGEVADPVGNAVIAYAPLKDTCDLGFCVADQLDPGASVIDGVACCNPTTGVCEAPDEDGLCSVGDITWCEKLEENGDGTVTCHE